MNNYTDMAVHIHEKVQGGADKNGSAVWAKLATGRSEIVFFPRPTKEAITELADALVDAARDLLAIAEKRGS